MNTKLSLLFVIVIVFCVNPIQSDAQTIAGGNGHSVALCADSSLNAWGFNISGQAGNGSNSNVYNAVGVSGLNEVIR
jgi:alpha-tubulin suppressor-like RCC1 family protein